MNRKRDRLEVIHDMLHAIRDKRGLARPTHILYKSNLSHQMMIEYLSELLEKGLVIESTDRKGHKGYELTIRGHDYLRDYQAIKAFIDSYGLD